MKKGQVTIFIILGLVILIIFVFLFTISRNIKTQELKEQREKVITYLLSKEGFRIFVEDCLEDNLIEGIQLLGEQGAIWDEQGGSHVFTHETGVVFNEQKISYGIVYDGTEHLYPCDEECDFSYPDLNYTFGKKVHFPSSMERDLEVFLFNNATKCVEEKIQENVTGAKEFSSEEAEFQVTILSDGISVDVNYPLRFDLAGEELFQLSTFNFYFPTPLKKLVDAAITNPLVNDVRYLDYNLSQDTLTNETFTYLSPQPLGNDVCEEIDTNLYKCQKRTFVERYTSQGLELTKYLLPEYDILEYGLPEGTLPSVIRIARQNRPPALDYISRCPSNDYDYLVLTNVPALKNLTFTASAIDPDEDDVTYFLESLEFDGGYNFQPSSDMTLNVSATDGLLYDWQNVRVHVDSSTGPQINFTNLVNKDQPPSIEDPICLNVSAEDITFKLRGTTFSSGEQTLPTGNQPCVLSGPIQTIDEDLLTQFLISAGETSFDLSGDLSYGEDCEISIESTQTVQINNCTYFEDPEFPNPYFNTNSRKLTSMYLYGPDGRVDDDRSPFLAAHLCCDSEGNFIQPSETPIFEHEGCFENDYNKQTILGFCDGKRGNVINNFNFQNPEIKTCGNNELGEIGFGCKNIRDDCKDKPAFALIKNDGWCGGKGSDGCSENTWCNDEIVYVGTDPVESLITFGPDGIPYVTDISQFKCGCNANDVPSSGVGTLCDGNFDGGFQGNCDKKWYRAQEEYRYYCKEGETP